MAYLKCALVGILTGTAAAVILPIAGVLLAFHSVASSGEGGLGSVSVGLPSLLLVWLVGFALGFFMMRRRQRRS